MTTLFVRRSRTGLFALSMVAVVWSRIAIGGEPSPGPTKLSPTVAGRVVDITDAVLEHHIDPPTRQQMILSGIKALYRAADLPDPAGLSARVSMLTMREQFAALLTETWPAKPAKPVSNEALEEALVNGLLKWVPGDAELISAKDQKVADQIKGNRYVGIHISLGMDEKERRPTIGDVIPGGPASKAQLQHGDLIEQIDEFDTKDKPLREIVDRIRGEEGTLVTIKVRQPQSSNSRIYKIPRGTLPRSTVYGSLEVGPNGCEVRIDGPKPIGYLRIAEFAGSTAHELRKLAGRLESQGYRALVLDLRGLRGDSVHPVVLLADSLLEGGTIGRVRTAHGEKTYEADSDALFRGWPIAVLADGSTSGTAEWLAAALQDNHRAVVVGSYTSPVPVGAVVGEPSNLVPSHRDAVERSTVPVGDGTWSITLITGQLERGDGRPLSGEAILPPRFPLRTTKPGKIQFGVKPDHLIGGDEFLGARRIPRPGPAGQNPQRPMANDEVLDKAIDVLRESLKKKV